MNGFEKHGIDHSSASQINMWSNAPCAWVAKYIYGRKFFFTVAPKIGLLVEDVVTEVLMGGDFENALEKAEKEFNRFTAFNFSEKDRARKPHIREMAQIALNELKPFGEPEFIKQGDETKQQFITTTCKGSDWELPVIGYLDFVYPKHKLIIDLKTTLRAPSAMSDAHKTQGAIYKHAKEGFDVRFLYVTPKKAVWHEIENHMDIMAGIKATLIRQEKLLRTFDKEELLSVIPVIPDTYYWSGDEGVRKELYGI